MNKPYQLLLALGIAAASLSSCSRANYVVNTATPTAESVQLSTPASDAAASGTAMVSVTMPDEVVAPARQAATALAHRAAPAQAKTTTTAVASAEAAAPKAAATKAERKALRQELKRQLAAAPKEVAADGKSQTTALLLLIFLGFIGVHRFYLGYTGRGFLHIALFLTSILIIPAIVNFVLEIIDLIKIINGDLKPKGGDYAKKFKGQ